MANFPYVQATARLPKLLTELRGRGKPPAVDQAWLRGAGFTSSNDRAFIPLLKFLGILGAGGTPTAVYDRLRQPDWEAQFASIIRAAYKQVFDALPNAPERTRQELVDQFRSLDLNATDRTAGLMVSTLQALVGIADFSGSEEESVESMPTEPLPVVPVQQPGEASHRNGVTLTINLSLELPATDKPEVYDMLFKSMAEHLGELVSRNGD